MTKMISQWVQRKAVWNYNDQYKFWPIFPLERIDHFTPVQFPAIIKNLAIRGCGFIFVIVRSSEEDLILLDDVRKISTFYTHR